MRGLGGRGSHQQEPSTSASYADSVGAGTVIRASSGRTSLTGGHTGGGPDCCCWRMSRTAERGRDPDPDKPPPWRHRLVLEAERAFPGAASTAWRDAGAGFNRSTETGRQAGTVSQTLSDRARARALAAERPEPPASRGLVKRLFEWLRERVQKMLGRFRPSRAARDLAGQLIAAASTAARQWGNITPATDTLISAAGVDRRPAGNVGVTAGGPRADQLGDGALGRSLDRGRGIETLLPG